MTYINKVAIPLNVTATHVYLSIYKYTCVNIYMCVLCIYICIHVYIHEHTGIRDKLEHLQNNKRIYMCLCVFTSIHSANFFPALSHLFPLSTYHITFLFFQCSLSSLQVIFLVCKSILLKLSMCLLF